MLGQLLSAYYKINSVKKVTIASRTGFKDKEYVYFITTHQNKEDNCEFQFEIGRYLLNVGFEQIAYPIRNKYGEWYTIFEGETYYVLRLKLRTTNMTYSNQMNLSTLHHYGRYFLQKQEIHPVHLNWKKDWIKELTLFEDNVLNQKEKIFHSSTKRIVNFMPYLIGLCENVIALTRELNNITDFNGMDYKTFTFYRFREKDFYTVIWTDELLIDHFMRDLAEYVRYSLLNHQDTQVVWKILGQYPMNHLISVYSWNLFFIRLLYPQHLLDFLKEFLNTKNNRTRANIDIFLLKHDLYLKKIVEIKNLIEQKEPNLILPMLKWL